MSTHYMGRAWRLLKYDISDPHNERNLLDPLIVNLIFSRCKNIITSLSHCVAVGGALDFQSSNICLRANKVSNAMMLSCFRVKFVSSSGTPNMAIIAHGAKVVPRTSDNTSNIVDQYPTSVWHDQNVCQISYINKTSYTFAIYIRIE